MTRYCYEGKHISEKNLPLLGGKAGAFALLHEHRLAVPVWFCVVSDALVDQLSATARAYYDAGELTALAQELAQNFVLDAETTQEIIARTDEQTYYAVRSSARSEDSFDASFAGQLESYLWVSRADIPQMIVKVWISGLSERVEQYRAARGIVGAVELPSVIVQRMVRADCAGVAFGANPINADLCTQVVSAVHGLGSALVSGETDADSYTLCGGQVRVQLGKQELWDVIENDQLVRQPLPQQLVGKQVLTDLQVQEIAALTVRVGEIFGKHQDIEWAYEAGQLFLLQSRPITTLGATAEEHGRTIIFDNSNIAESYGGATTPLTASFIRMVYEEVYRQFATLFGVPKQVITAHAETFRCMLGFADGRVYYNLLSWYRLISILPGYALNRGFMEQMMGVKEPLPPAFLDAIKPLATKGERVRDFFVLANGIRRLLVNYHRLEREIVDFYARVRRVCTKGNLAQMRLDELYDYFYELQGELMMQWNPPLVNDFFAMIYHGLLRSLCKKMNAPEGLHNDLLCGQGGIISAQPARMVRALADSAHADQELVDALSGGSLVEIRELLESRPTFSLQVQAYLDAFSDRCLDELKLESRTIRDDPMLLFRSIGSLAQGGSLPPPTPPATIELAQYGTPLTRMLFRYVKKNAVRLVKNRENLRFERTRVFGLVRQLFLEIGMRLASLGVLEKRADIFFLQTGEILAFIDGTGVCTDLKGLVELRRAEYERNRARPDPPRRFFVNGGACAAPRYEQTASATTPAVTQNLLLTGLACCSGIVTGRARVIIDPAQAVFHKGEVLVARRTDPGWIMLFSLAGAIVIERGSLLSHAAIVSREMGIVSVVSVDHAASLIRTGDTIRVDGARGTVEIVERAEGKNEDD